jgi:hypothetical protein
MQFFFVFVASFFRFAVGGAQGVCQFAVAIPPQGIHHISVQLSTSQSGAIHKWVLFKFDVPGSVIKLNREL